MGGLGCPLLSYLASSGISNIGIVDHDKIELGNLNRQILFDSSDLGKYKVNQAKIKIKNNKARIQGNTKVMGAGLMSSDLRASVALVLAAMVSRGKSIINRIYHLDRGYENIEKKLRKINVNIKRLK